VKDVQVVVRPATVGHRVLVYGPPDRFLARRLIANRWRLTRGAALDYAWSWDPSDVTVVGG
jgi:hypothetical protein